MLTKYSEVLPDGSLTPPPKTVVEVLWTWGVDDLECEAEDAIDVEDVNPPFRTVLPCNQDVMEDECLNHVMEAIINADSRAGILLYSSFIIALVPILTPYLFIHNLPSITQHLYPFANSFLQSPAMASQQDWRKALNNLPSTPENIPAFFFAHGSPILAFSKSGALGEMASYQGASGPLAQFLADFGSTLLQKYKPKAIVVFSAHWETMTERQGMSASIYLPCPLVIMDHSHRLQGGKPSLDGLLWLPSRVISAEIQVERWLGPFSPHCRSV